METSEREVFETLEELGDRIHGRLELLLIELSNNMFDAESGNPVPNAGFTVVVANDFIDRVGSAFEDHVEYVANLKNAD